MTPMILQQQFSQPDARDTMGHSYVLGDPQLWLDTFPDGQITEIIQLALNVWSHFPRTNREELEVSITRRFRSPLIQDKNLRREVAVSIRRESVEDNINSGEELGRIDLRLHWKLKLLRFLAFS